jgi:plastocyanin
MQQEIADTLVSPTHGTMLQLVRKVEGLGRGAVRHNRKNMPHNFEPKILKMKKGDTVSWMWGNLRAVCWKDRGMVYAVTNIHSPPAEGNFRDESGNPVKPLVIEDYNTRMGYVD